MIHPRAKGVLPARQRLGDVPMKCVAALPVLLVLMSLPAAADTPVASTQQLLKRMDRNNDGTVSFEEYRNAVSRRLHALDRDGDGQLQDGESPPEWRVGEAGGPGVLTQSEFAAHLPTVFQEFDRNQDGQLDHDELDTLAAARAARLEAKP